LIYNLGETSLLLRIPIAPVVGCHSSKISPMLLEGEKICGCIVVFIVECGKGHCPSTSIINSKANLEQLKDYVNIDLDVKFHFFYFNNL
jgi:hypothetical protein